MDDLWRARIGVDDTIAPDPGRRSPGTPAFAARVTSTGTLSIGDFVRVEPVDVSGAEVNGTAGVFTAGTTHLFALPIGPGAPVTGDLVIVRRVEHRWVFDKKLTGGGGGIYGNGHIPNCFCDPIPGTLTMTSADPACNYQMFQSCTIQWQPTPPSFGPLNLGPNAFISNESFSDPIGGGAMFFYYLNCTFNQFSLTRIYPTSPYGSPYRDGILYTWLLGATGNTCLPFHLDNGSAFPGSDVSCSVTIDQA